MTLAERRYYQIAIGLSILLHAALFLIAFPHSLGFGNGSGNQMDTISAGLMDFDSGESDSGLTDQAGIGNGAIEEVVTQPEPEQPESEVKSDPPKEVPSIKTSREPEIVHQEKVTKPKKVEQPKVEPKLQPKPENVKTVKSDNPVTDAKQAVKDKNGKPGGTGGGNGTGEGKGNGAGSGNGGKGGGGRLLGSGNGMVASGLEIDFGYPKNAQNENKEGDVRLRALIDRNGNLENIEPLQSSGDLRLDNAVKKFVGRMKFKKIDERYYVDLLIMFRIANEEPILKWLEARTRP